MATLEQHDLFKKFLEIIREKGWTQSDLAEVFSLNKLTDGTGH